MSTPLKRALYFGVCVPVRLTLAYILFSNEKSFYVRWALVIASSVSVIRNSSLLHENVWWSRSTHLNTSVIIFLLAVLNRIKMASTVMVYDVVIGLVTFFTLRQ